MCSLMLNNYICALDIGSSKIAGAVAVLKRKRITEIFFDSVPAKGIKRGVIINSIDLIDSITRVLKNLKNKSGINIKFIYASISGEDIVTKHSRAIIPLAERGNKVITLSDIRKVNEQARILGSNLEEEIIHQIPFSYTIDSKTNIPNPLGLYSHTLEIDLYLVCCKLSTLQSLTRVINQAGYETKDLFFSGLVTSEVIFDKENSQGTNIFCDIGSDMTELLIFQDRILKDIVILPVGGENLAVQLASNLNITLDLAEDVKRSYGIIGDYEKIKEDKEILIKKDNIYKTIQQKLACQILTSETKSICAKIKDAISKRVDLIQVNNFVTTGRTVLLEGFLEMLENCLGVPVRLGRIRDPKIISLVNDNHECVGQKYLTYITALGLINRILHTEQPSDLSAVNLSRNIILNTVNKFKEIYQEYF